jgi:antitoxin component YwqK of YwqJK toxin-antitoxin module
MKITLEMLEDKNIGSSMRNWFIENFGKDGIPDHTEMLQKQYEQKSTSDYGAWLLIKFGLSGTATYWYDDGNERRDIPYVDGKQHGLETFWHYNDNFVESWYYIHGIEVTKQEWEEYEENQTGITNRFKENQK